MNVRTALVMAGCALAATVAAGQGPGGVQEGPAPDPSRVLAAPDIPGAVKGGTKVEFIRAGFNGTEGVIAMPDGSVLFTEQDADKILRIDPAPAP
jgi:gluconolactonase